MKSLRPPGAEQGQRPGRCAATTSRLDSEPRTLLRGSWGDAPVNDHPELQAMRSSQTSGAPATGVAHGWLVAGRVLWLLLLAFVLVPFGQSLPSYRESFTHPGPQSSVLPPQAVAALAQVGVSLATYAWISFGVTCAVVIFSLIVALALYWRRRNDWMALFASLFLVIYTAGSVSQRGTGLPSASYTTALQTALAAAQSALLFALTAGVATLFPSGRFVPRRSWLLVISVSVWGALITVAPLLGGGILILGYPLLIIACVAAIIYRYRRVSTPVERLQTRWIITGFIATLLGNQIFWLPSSFTPLAQTIYPPVMYQIYQLSLALVPITFFVAIQRYHLYNIDTLINRALVYGSLTATLAALYLALVIGGQSALRALAGGQATESPLIIVLSTLAVAALVQPLRRRLQATIDRRFYRRKYDAARTLASFGATLRNEVELSALSEHLVAVVEETMQPERVWLWLRPTRARATEHFTNP